MIFQKNGFYHLSFYFMRFTQFCSFMAPKCSRDVIMD